MRQIYIVFMFNQHSQSVENNNIKKQQKQQQDLIPFSVIYFCMVYNEK